MTHLANIQQLENTLSAISMSIMDTCNEGRRPERRRRLDRSLRRRRHGRR